MRNVRLWSTFGNRTAWLAAVARATLALAPAGSKSKANPLADEEPREVHFKDLVIETFPEEDKLVTVQAA